MFIIIIQNTCSDTQGLHLKVDFLNRFYDLVQ